MSTPSQTTPTSETWDMFMQLQQRRRAIRDFSPRPVDPVDLDAVLMSAGLAPTSMGMQPYEFHVVINPDLKNRMAEACHGQRAAKSAPVLVAVAVSPAINRRRIDEAIRYYRDEADLPQKSRDYHLSGIAKLTQAHNALLVPFLGMVRFFLSAAFPARSFLPLGAQGLRDWAARNAMMAAQNVLLAASARGIDSCPMEGFNGAAVARLLGLPWQSAVPVVIALGYRAENAHVETQWRRDKRTMVVEH